MKTNLFLLALIAVGGWYLYNLSAPAPVAPPVAAPAAPVAKTNYSGVRTFYSTLNDPAVPVGTRYLPATGYPASGAARSTASPLSLGSTSTASGVSTQPTSSSIGPRPANYGANGEPTLNIKQRATNISAAAKGE